MARRQELPSGQDLCVAWGLGPTRQKTGLQPGSGLQPDSGLCFRVAGRWDAEDAERAERTHAGQTSQGSFCDGGGYFLEKWLERSLGKRGITKGLKLKVNGR